MKCIQQQKVATERQQKGVPRRARWVPAVLIALVALLTGSPFLHAAELLPNPNPSGNTITLPDNSTATVSGYYINNGTIGTNSGNATVTLHILPGATYEDRSYTVLNSNNRSNRLIVQGTLNVAADNYIFLLMGSILNPGTINNRGYFAADAYGTANIHQSSGTINNYYGFEISGRFENSGTFENHSGGLNILGGSTFFNAPFASFNNSADANVTSFYPTYFNGRFENQGFATNSGWFRLLHSASLLLNDSIFTNTSTGTIRAANVTNNANFYNYGTVYTGFFGGVGLINTSIFENYGTLATPEGTLNISGIGALRNYGTVLVGLDPYGSIGGGTLLFGANSSYTGNGSIVLYGPSQLTNNANNSVNIAALDAAQNSTAVINGSGTTNITAGRVLGNGQLTYSGTGSLGIGTLTLDNGAVLVNSGSNLGIGTAIVGAGNSATISGANALTLGTANVDGALTVSAPITGAGSLTKLGAGLLTLTGANTYSGGTTVSGGVLQGNTTSLQGNILNNASVVFDQAGNGTYAGVMSGSGALTKQGAGLLTLTGANTYSGSTTVNAGVLQAGRANIFSATAPVQIANTAGAIFDLNGFDQTIGGLTGGGATGGTVSLGTASLTVQNNTDNTFGGTIGGTGTLTKLGTGTLTLGGTSNYGNTTINAGTLSNTGSFTSSGALTNLATFQSSGTLDNTNVVDNYNAFSNSGTFTNNGLVVNNAGGVITNSGTLNNANSIFNSGVLSNSGTLTSGNALVNLMLMDNSGTLNNNAAMLNLGSFNSSGMMNNNGPLFNVGALTIGAGGVFNHTAAADYNDAGVGMLIVGGTLNNSSTNPFNLTNLSFTGGTFTNTGAGGANITTATVGTGTSGLIQGGGTLTLSTANIDGTLTVNSVISGAGALTKLGTGTLYLNGTNTYTGGTNITGGALSVNGSILGPVSIGAAGILKGSGSINGSVTNSGMLAPGNSIGTTTINGNYTHNAGAIYQVEANAAGQADKLNVTGTATLNGGTVAVLAENGRYRMKTDYTILSAGNVQGSFSTVTSNLAFLTPSLRYDPSNVYLTLTRNSTSFADVAYTQNQRAVAMTLDRISPITSGDMMTVMDNLLMVSDSGARSAYNQMGGLSHTAMAGATFSSLNQYMGTLSGRMESHSLGKTADAGRAQYASNSQIANDASPAGKAIEQAQWDIWIRGYGTKGYHRGDDISSNYDHWSGGSTIGIDRRLSREILFGISAGYSHSELTMNDLPEKGKADSYQMSVYGAYRGEALYVNSQLSYGYNRYDISRSIMFGGINRIAESDYSGHALSAAIEAGYRIKTSCIDIIPLIGFQAAYLSRNSFAEHGADSLNLNANSESTNSLLSAVGFRLTKDYTVGSGILTPELRAKWLHEFSNDSYVLNAAFSGYPVMAFSVKGDRPDRDSAAVGLGVNYAPQKNLSLYLTYDAHLASDRTEHAGSVGVRYTW